MPVTRRYVRREIARSGGGDSSANSALFLGESENLSDLDSPATARANLGAVAKAGDTMTGALTVEFSSSGAYAGTFNNWHASGHGIQMGLGSGTGNAFGVTASGDNHHRWLVDASGKQAWGNGTDARDTFQERSAAGQLKVTGALQVTGKLAVDGSSNALNHADFSLLAWNIPWWSATTSTILPTAGLVHVCKVPIPRAMTITNVEFYLSTAGSSLTSGQNFAALYSGAKALLAATADQTTAWETSGRKTMALTSPQAVSAGYVYVAFFANGSTLPTPARGASSAINNAGLSAANAHWATADSGRTTSMPATLGTFTGLSTGYVVGVS